MVHRHRWPRGRFRDSQAWVPAVFQSYQEMGKINQILEKYDQEQMGFGQGELYPPFYF